MTFNFKTFSTNMKDTFYTMEKYWDGRSKQEKVFTLLENIFMTNQRLESEITFFRYNNNGKYLAETNYLSTQINFIFPAQQPIQKKHCDCNKRNVSHVKKENFRKTKSCNGIAISYATRLFLSE